MLFLHYYETVLEQWISDHYRANGITTPEDLDIGRIAAIFGVDLHHDTCKSFSDNEEMVIVLHNRLATVAARMIFFHELCHVIRHVGDQRKMPELFKEAQEAEASSFLLYASMPFYIISKLQLPPRQNDAIKFLASTFQVPLKISKQRLEQIQRRELQGIMMAAAKNSLVKQPIVPPKPPETKIYAYYDPTGEFDAPSQIIVCVDEQTLHTQEEIIFSPNGPFDRIEDSQLDCFQDSKPVLYDDMDYKDGMVTVKINYLANRHRNTVYNFVIQRKELEEVLEFHGEYF